MNRTDMCISHDVQDTDSFQSLAIKYDVSVRHDDNAVVACLQCLFSPCCFVLKCGVWRVACVCAEGLPSLFCDVSPLSSLFFFSFFFFILLVPSPKVEDILHLNRLYATDNIHLRKTLLIPAPRKDGKGKRTWKALQPEHVREEATHDHAMNEDEAPNTKDMSAEAFLKQFDEQFAMVKSSLETTMSIGSTAATSQLPSFVPQSTSGASSASTSSSNSKSSSKTHKRKQKDKAVKGQSSSKGDDPGLALADDTHLFEL